MSWAFLDGTKFTSAETLYEMTFDGRDMWVSASANKVKIYSFWGDSDQSEEEIDLTSYLSDVKHIIKAYDEMYIFNDEVTEFVRVNITSRAVVGDTTSIKYSTKCVPAYGNFKIWFATDEVDEIQSLFYYDIIDGSWSTPVDIPGRHQTSKRKIVWSKGDFIFVTQVNESAVAKFDASDGSFVISIITNRMPAGSNHLFVNDARDVLVCGFNGMVTAVDQVTNTPVNIGGLNDTSETFTDDGTYLWTTEPSLARITKGVYTNNYLVMAEVPSISGESHSNVYEGFGFALDQPDITSLSLVKEGVNTLIEDVDYTFGIDPVFNEQRMVILEGAPNVSGEEPLTIKVDYSYNTQLSDFNIIGFSDTVFKQVAVTPTYTHQYWDGTAIQTKTEEQRTVLLANKAIYFAYNLADSWNLIETRSYNLAIKGTALVGTGPNIYHGETQ